MTRNIFKELAETSQWPCISIYIPTQRTGDNKKAQIRFKNQVTEVRDVLRQRNMKARQVDELTSPLTMLLEDSEIWRHLSDGLAVFLSPGKFAYSTFPIRFREHAEVNGHFYLLPLMPVFNGDGRFFVLALSLNKVRLLEGSRDHVEEIGIEDLVPQNMKESLGDDYEQKSLQFRSGQTGGEQGLFHGQGRGKDSRKDDIVKHFREVSKSLAGIIQSYDVPMVVACVDYLFPIFRGVNTYPHLYKKHLPGNPDELLPQDLHQGAWAMLKDDFQHHRQETLRKHDFLSSKGRTTSILDDISQAAADGRIDTLFIRRGEQHRLTLDGDNRGLLVGPSVDNEEVCLLDLVAKTAFLQGARVYLMDATEMPEGGAIATASLRY